jgi:MFS transporter, FHS family, L-fucose permease
MTNMKKNNYGVAFAVITILFFMWGFVTVLNDILIPFLKKMFELNRFQSMFVQFSFFGAYFVGSVAYFMTSIFKGDPMSRIGYKNGLLLGLGISALACIGFYPAAAFQSFNMFLGMLFMLGIGFTMLQIAANPYVALLGKSETASSRLNLSQAFNSLGTTIAPIIGGYLIFHFFAKIGTPLLNLVGKPILTDAGLPMTALGVQLPYLVIAGVFLLLAALIKFTPLPQFASTGQINRGFSLWKYPHLLLGMIAIFTYVGAEVSVGSLFINYSKELVNFTEMTAKSFLAFYWGGLMIGRFLGAISLGDNKSKASMYLKMFFASLVSYLLIYSIVFFESGFAFKFINVAPFLIFMALQFIGFALGKSNAARTLLFFSTIVIGLLTTTMLTSGYIALWAIIGVGLFNSIMWSNIFTLAIKDLDQHTSQASSLLVMMILGGALVPLLQGKIADIFGGYHLSFFIPMICYSYLMYYGFKGHALRHKEIAVN